MKTFAARAVAPNTPTKEVDESLMLFCFLFSIDIDARKDAESYSIINSYNFEVVTFKNT